MHGLLRFDSKARDPASESFDKLVLTEQQYFDFTGNPTSLFTYSFLYLLREHSCLFIGLSMQDENIRRLLHVLHKERLAALKEEEKHGKARVEEKATRHFAVLPEHRTRELNDTIAQLLLQLGVTVLWVDDRFAELPDRLGEMYSKLEGADWTAVYASSVR
jgi:SIR2-like protein